MLVAFSVRSVDTSPTPSPKDNEDESRLANKGVSLQQTRSVEAPKNSLC